MFLRKLRLLAELVGFIVITLLCLYGSMAFFTNAHLVFATGNAGRPPVTSLAAPADRIALAPQRANLQQTSNPSLVVPPYLNYQGVLRDKEGKPLPNGDQYNVTFRIYDDVTKPVGEQRWEEPISGVTVRDGRFSVLLGNTNPLPADLFHSPNRFLGVQVEGYDEIQPRQRFASVPYSTVADQAYGLSAANGGPRNVISVNGNGGLQIGQAPSMDNTADVELKVYGDGQGNLLLQNWNGQWGRLNRWTDRFEIVGSDEVRILTDKPEGTINIGSITIDNQGNLGNPNRSTTLNLFGARIGDIGDGRLFIRGGSDIVTFDGENDKVGIGTTDPQAKLDVNGDFRVQGNFTNFRIEGPFTLDSNNLHGSAGRPNRRAYEEEISLGSLDKRFCFLTSMTTRVTTDDPADEQQTCKVYNDGSNWTLWAYAKDVEEHSRTDSDVECIAMCFTWGVQ